MCACGRSRVAALGITHQPTKERPLRKEAISGTDRFYSSRFRRGALDPMRVAPTTVGQAGAADARMDPMRYALASTRPGSRSKETTGVAPAETLNGRPA